MKGQPAQAAVASPVLYLLFGTVQQLKLGLYCSIPVALNTSRENRLLYFPLLTLTEPSKQGKELLNQRGLIPDN